MMCFLEWKTTGEVLNTRCGKAHITYLAIPQCLQSNTVILLLAVDIFNCTVYFLAKLLLTLLTSKGVTTHVNFVMSEKAQIILQLLWESTISLLSHEPTFL